MRKYMVFSGSSNKVLAEEVAKKLGVPLGKVDLQRFADGEARPWIQDNVRGKVIFVVQSFSNPIDQNLMELAFMADAIRGGSPKSLIAIIPYMGYSRQDRRSRSGEPISARVVAKLIEMSKFDEVVTVDLHSSTVAGFFDMPVTNISGENVFSSVLKSYVSSNTLLVAPDVGSAKRSRNLAQMLGIDMVIIEKNRPVDQLDKTESLQINGDVTGKTVIIFDDMISTGGTIIQSVRLLKQGMAKRIIVFATHGVFANDAVVKILDSGVEKIVITNSIEQQKPFKSVQLVSLAPILGKTIKSLIFGK